MVRDLYKEKAEVFWPFEKKSWLGKDHIEGKDRWEKRKRDTENVMGKKHTRCFRYFLDRS